MSARFLAAMQPAQRLRLLLLLVVGLFALVVRFVLLSSGEAVELIRTFGYWAIAVIVAIAALAIFRSFRSWRLSWLLHGWPLVASVACAVFLQLHEPRKLKVLYDEYVLTTISLQMHLERMAVVPAQAQYEQGRIVHFSGFVDKRPLLFPFLLSLAHDVSGYRVANVFVLNGLISVVLFWFVFWIGEAIGGRRFGYAGMLILAGIPLVANVATSGIFDLFNLALLAGLFLAARRYLEDPTGTNQNLLVMTAVLIANTRYESILFLFSVASVVGVVWWRNRRIEVTWLSVVSPLMVLPVLLCNLIHLSYSGFTQNQDVGVSQFELANVALNLSRDIYYLFDFSGLQSNSVLVSYGGVVALLLVIVGMRSILSKGTNRPDAAVVFFSILPVILGVFVIMLFYWWGQFDDPMATRFSLPLQFALVIAMLLAVSQVRLRERAGIALSTIAALMMWVWAVPGNARHASSLITFTVLEVEWQVEQVLSKFDHRTMVFCESALPLVAHRRPAIPFIILNEDPKRYWRLKTAGLYDQLLVFQTIRVDPETGKETDISNDAPTDNLKLETILETRFSENVITRFSRWVGFKDEAETQTGAKETNAGASETDEREPTTARGVTEAVGTGRP